MRKKTIYIAGPMRGYPRYNFDAFDEAQSVLRERCAGVISPAEMDRDFGFDPDADEATPEFMQDAMCRDLTAILERVDAIALLPGWEKSEGAQIELAVARWKKIPAFVYPSMELLGEESILDEAIRVTHGARRDDYGHPASNLDHIANLWSAYKDVVFTASDVAAMMICVKLSRQAFKQNRDNWTDIAGYAWCGSECDKMEEG